jgi:hypothetical protein
MAKQASPNSSISTGLKIFFLLFIVVAIVVLLWASYLWFGCRFYVPAGKFAVVTSKVGKTPKAGTLLVEKDEKGIWKEVLAEGRHFLDPFKYEYKICDALEIPLGKIGIVTAKTGKELPPGETIAPDATFKGVQLNVLGPGTYRLNPEGDKVEITDAVNIPAGYAGVITNQYGKTPTSGQFAKIGEKGIIKDVLQPGLYYINRYASQINVFEIGMNQVTMSDNSNGSAVQTRNRLVNANTALKDLEENTLNFQTELRKELVNQKKVQDSRFVDSRPRMLARSFGSHRNYSRANSPMKKSKKIIIKKPVVTAAAQIFGLSKAVEFPSRDGFKVILDMTVEFELEVRHISTIYLLYGDLPQVVNNIIMPQVLSVSRLKGSSYRAQDFIMGDGREKFQADLQKELEKTLASKNITVHNAIIRNVEIPKDILQPIQAVSLAKEQDLTNIAMQDTARKLAQLNSETELIEQRRREVDRQTEKLVAEIAADSRMQTAAISATTNKKVAEINLKRSEILAKIVQLKGETDAKAKYLVENAKAEGELLKAKVLGEGGLLKLKAAENLNPKVKTQIIYAGQGTLWTDLNKASLTVPAK